MLKKRILKLFILFRRLVLWILVFLLVLVLVLYLIANSTLAVKKIVESIAPDYNISYDSIEGNLLSGFELNNPQFNNKTLAQKVLFKWNPNTLIDNQVTIHDIAFEHTDVDSLKSLIAFINKDNPIEETNATQSEEIKMGVSIEHIDISLKPFTQEGISFSNLHITSNNIAYQDDKLSIEDLKFNTQTNLSNISLSASYKDNIVIVDNLNLQDLNLTLLQSLLETDNNSTEAQESIDISSDNDENLLLPKKVIISNLETSILPYSYDNINTEDIIIKAKDLNYSLENKSLNTGLISIMSHLNISDLNYTGNIQKNILSGKIILIPKTELYTMYAIPINPMAIKKIVIDVNASKEHISAIVKSSATGLLTQDIEGSNLDINSLVSAINYDINKSLLDSTTDIDMSTLYANNITIHNNLTYSETLEYNGILKIKSIDRIDKKLSNIIKDLTLNYSGTQDNIETTFNSKFLKGHFISDDFKNAMFNLSSLSPMAVGDFVELPNELKHSKVNIDINVPLNFDNMSNIKGDIKVDSNVVNLDANIEYAKTVKIKGKIKIPSDSLVKNYDPAIKWERFSTLDFNAQLKENTLNANIISKNINSEISYGLDTNDLRGTLSIGTEKIEINGNPQQDIIIYTHINAIPKLMDTINTFYPIAETPPVSGEVDLKITINKLSRVNIAFKSPTILYEADKKTKYKIDDISLIGSFEGDTFLLKSYSATYDKQKYYATKIAKIALGETIYLDNLWINNSLKLKGNFNTTTQKGKLFADADKFHLKDKMITLDSKINLVVTLDKLDTQVEGKIILLNGKITPTTEGKSFVSDSDIIILQHKNKNKKSPFMQNLSLNIQIENKKGLTLKQDQLNLKLKPSFTLTKDRLGDIIYLGSVDLLRGGSYIFEDKKFILLASAVYFTGDVNKPLLDIKAQYKSLNHLITITVTGTPTQPNIQFASSPSLSREQILSVILFDSELGGDTRSGPEMMKMMGGAMAKAALSDAGVKVDHLAFGEGNSIEIGKKLNNKTTIIYINGEIPKVKLKYQHGTYTESVLGASQESQSYDIIYKRDF